MATETIAPAPAGVQSTFNKPLGPQSSKSERAGIWKKTFDELTHEDVKPQGQETPPDKPSPGEPAPEPVKPEPKPEPASSVEPSTPDKKPESPLDVVIGKGNKEAPPVEEPDVLKEFDDVKTPASEHWQKLKGIAKTQSSELKVLQEKVKSFDTAPKPDPALATKVQELEAALADRDTRLKAAGAEYSPEYQKLVQDHQNITGKIATRMKSFGGDADSLVEALALPYGKYRSAQIEEVLSGLDAGKQARIQTLIEEQESHAEKIMDFKKDLPSKWNEIQANQEAQMREQHDKMLKQLDTEFLKIAENIPESIVTMREVPEDVPGGTEWNKEIKEARANALRVLKPDGADFNESASIALKGARYDTLEKRYLALHSDYSDLKSKYNEAVGSGPDFRGGIKPKEAPKAGPKGAKGYHETLAAVKAGEEF